jgi:hypothetical protein
MRTTEGRQAADAVARGDMKFEFDEAGLAELPPVAETSPMVTKTMKWRPETYLRIKEQAEARGISAGAFIRECVEAQLAALDGDRVVSLADVQRALGALAHRAA